MASHIASHMASHIDSMWEAPTLLLTQIPCGRLSHGLTQPLTQVPCERASCMASHMASHADSVRGEAFSHRFCVRGPLSCVGLKNQCWILLVDVRDIGRCVPHRMFFSM